MNKYNDETGPDIQLSAEFHALEGVGNPVRRIRNRVARLRWLRFALTLAVCVAAIGLVTAGAYAADDNAASISAAPVGESLSQLTQTAQSNRAAGNLGWVLGAAFLVMFMQAGFALVEAGLCRAKSAAHVMSMNLMIYGLGTVGFWVCGFALMFGGLAHGPVPIGFQHPLGDGIRSLNSEWAPSFFGHSIGLLGGRGFFLDPSRFDAGIFALFLFNLVFLNIAATIPTGAMAERWNFKNFMLYGLWAGALPFAIFGNWVWGGGWLSQLGRSLGLGHGHVDFAGSSVVHLCGGMIGLAGALILGPRLGKFGPSGRPRPIPGHNLVYVTLGTLILVFGWFGITAGSALSGSDARIAVIVFNTMLAAAAGGIGAYVTMVFKFGKPDPSILCNGVLAGLVAVSAPCAFVNPPAAFIIGAVAGIAVVHAVIFVEGTLRVDDPVGAVSVHGLSGAWGALSVGIFANGAYGAGWGGVHKLLKAGQTFTLVNDGTAATVAKYREMTGPGPSGGWADVGVTGALGPLFGAPMSDWSQLGAQCVGVLTCFVFVGGFAYGWFKLSNSLVRIRSRRDDELAGLDLQEMGAECYPDFQLTDKSSPRVS
jgi:Amt family ammonium transporter